MLDYGIYLFVNDTHGVFKSLCVGSVRQRSDVDFDGVRVDARHNECGNTLQEVELRRGQAVALNALPLFADEKVFVDLYVLIEIYPLVEALCRIVQLPSADEIRHLRSAEQTEPVFFRSSICFRFFSHLTNSYIGWRGFSTAHICVIFFSAVVLGLHPFFVFLPG